MEPTNALPDLNQNELRGTGSYITDKIVKHLAAHRFVTLPKACDLQIEQV